MMFNVLTRNFIVFGIHFAPQDLYLFVLAMLTFIVFIVLRSSNWIQRKLGKGGEAILRKVFGIILLAIAVKLFKSNIGSLS